MWCFDDDCTRVSDGCPLRGFLDDQDGVEYVVPDLARDSEAEVEVLVVVSEVIFLHLLNICWES